MVVDRSDSEEVGTFLSVDEQDRNEKLWVFLLQVTIVILIAGFGTIGTGLLYGKAEKTKFFENVREVYMLAPPILGLKGNIEMTLVSRLSTFVNRKKPLSALLWLQKSALNLTLLWVQSFLLTSFACLLTLVVCSAELTSYANVIVLISSAINATTLASLILGSLMCLLIFVAAWLNINPDNIATPLSASMSDVVTLYIFMSIGSWEYGMVTDVNYVISYSGLTINLLLSSVFALLSYSNSETREPLLKGWIFLMLAVVLSRWVKESKEIVIFSCGGIVFRWCQNQFPLSPTFQPLLAGLSGNRAAIQCSRLSTALNLAKRDDELSLTEQCNPINVFSGQTANSKSAIFLILTSIPTQLFFLWILSLFHSRNFAFPEFVVCFALASLVQITLLIYLSHCVVSLLWRLHLNPDNSAIPIMTSLADLSGTALLYLMLLYLDQVVPRKVRNSAK